MEYGIINGYDNHLIDIVEFDINTETIFWFKWFNGTEWIEVKPFTEWALHYEDNYSNLKFLFGYNFGLKGEVDLIVYASVASIEIEVFNGKLTV
jgi:hypothetical protein